MDALLKKYAFEIGKFFHVKIEGEEAIKVERLILLFLVEYLEHRDKGE